MINLLLSVIFVKFKQIILPNNLIVHLYIFIIINLVDFTLLFAGFLIVTQVICN